MLRIEPSGAACGATVSGVALGAPIDASTLDALRAAWQAHGVVAFPDQDLSIADLERFNNLGDWRGKVRCKIGF